MADTKQIDWGDGTGEKITVTAASFVGNKGLQISSPENVKVTPRSKTIVLKSKTDPTKVARINVTQEKAVYTYDFSLAASVATIAAKGGTSEITAQLKTYRNGNLISTETVTPVLSGSATGFSISGTTVTASNRTTVVGAERSITVTGKYSGTYDGQEVSATVVVKQSLNEVVALKAIPTTGNDTILSYDSAVAASGGTVTPRKTGAANLTYSSGSTLYASSDGSVAGGYLSFSRTNTRVSGILSIASNGDATGSNLGTVISSETETVVAATIKATFTRGSDVLTDSRTDNVVVKQEANTATYGTITISGGTVADIPASGGKISSMSGISASQTVSYTSGATRDGNVSISYSSAVSASSLGTTVKARTKVGTLTATASGEGSKSATKSLDVYQQANTYKPQVFGFGLLDESGEFINTALLPASGEGIIGAVVVLISYTSGTEIKGNCDLIGTVSYSTPYIQEITGSETGEPSVPYVLFIQGVSRGKTIGPEEKVNLTAPITYKDITFTGTWELIVQANTVTEEWSSPSVTLKVDDIPASGGESSDYSTVTYSQEKRNVYTSGEYDVLQTVNTGGMVSFIRTVTGENLGTTIKSRTFLGYTRVGVTLNGKASFRDTDTYQEANSVESYTGDIIFTIDKSSPISGSLVSISVTELLVLNYTEVFSSGASLAKTPPAFEMSVLPSGAGVITTAIAIIQKNPSLTESRQITLRATVGTTSLYKDIVLIQNPFEPSLNLNKSVINFSQRGGSDTLQVTSNTEWDVNSNAEFAFPETLQIKYNPSTDVVELVD